MHICKKTFTFTGYATSLVSEAMNVMVLITKYRTYIAFRFAEIPILFFLAYFDPVEWIFELFQLTISSITSR